MPDKKPEKSTKPAKPAKLWGGRFKEDLSKLSEAISESISFDKKLFTYDIQASVAHTRMLEAQKIIPTEVSKKIQEGLEKVKEEIENGLMEFNPALEDIHTHIESRLVEIIGDDGKYLHTGRSRNDQVAVDTHLFLKHEIEQQKEELKQLLHVLVQSAEEQKDKIWAGYTHTQIAQPVYLGHYLMAYFWKFHRDYTMLDFALTETDKSPLGAAAMAGANYPINREQTAEELGFAEVYENSMDAVSNRDYQLSYHFFASRLFIHISRMCEDFILYNSTEFSYLKMGDNVTTGSSIMPQKKNPDISELLRGKTARVIGNFTALLMNLKGLPLTYNRDLQEDKVYLFDTVEQTSYGILGLTEVLKNTTYHPEKVETNLRKGFSQATDVADHLVASCGFSFRDAHEMTGELVKYCEKNHKLLDELKDSDYKEVWNNKATLPEGMLDLRSCIERKQGTGSTSSQSLAQQIEKAKNVLGG